MRSGRWRSARGAGSARSRAWTIPRRILLVQLDHLGDAVLTSPLLSRLRAAYPEAMIDVLASPSNREVFEADPRTSTASCSPRGTGSTATAAAGRWVRRSGRWAVAARGRYDLGIDVRGDILTVLVLALAGIPRRVGWAMGGGGFLLTDVADWIPGRHEVSSRLALLGRLGIADGGPARVAVHVTDRDRTQRGAMAARGVGRPTAVPPCGRQAVAEADSGREGEADQSGPWQPA